VLQNVQYHKLSRETISRRRKSLWIGLLATRTFDHANIIGYAKRPFATVEEMNEALLRNINAKVQPNDRLFHLGDFAKSKIEYFRKAINCRNVVLILGNHDRINYRSTLFSGVFDRFTLKTEIDGERKDIVLDHYAMKVWNKSHYGAWQLYGHSHGGLPDDETALAFDVGVDCHNYMPLNLQDIKAIMAKKKWVDPLIKWAQEKALWKPFDHHKPKEYKPESEWASEE